MHYFFALVLVLPSIHFEYLHITINYLLLCPKYIKVIITLLVICDYVAVSIDHVWSIIFTITNSYLAPLWVMLMMIATAIARVVPPTLPPIIISKGFVG